MELSSAQKARLAVRQFKTTADALTLRGFFKPSGKSGVTLEEGLRALSPEIYGEMNDPRIAELKGLEYIIERLPKGIEECTRIVLTSQEELKESPFEQIIPVKRRRISHRVSNKEMAFVVTRGISEIYDIITHLTFLNIEANKIYSQMHYQSGDYTREWLELKKIVGSMDEPLGADLDQAVWNLSILLGRTYKETRATYDYLEESKKKHSSNRGLFRIIYDLGNRVEKESESSENEFIIYFTPSLREMMGSQKYGRAWANNIKQKLVDLELSDRPLHIVSANLHSVKQLIFAPAALNLEDADMFEMVMEAMKNQDAIQKFAENNGLYDIADTSGTNIDCQIIDTAMLDKVKLLSSLQVNLDMAKGKKPVIIVMDYAFGAQAFEVIDELLNPFEGEPKLKLNLRSISVMGKAGILPGKKGDIMIAGSHVFEGTPHNYIIKSDLNKNDFAQYSDIFDVYKGPIITVIGTSLQNRDMLAKFRDTSWKAVGLEMEGGHYQRAINAAIIRNHIPGNTKVRYAYYASDNPLESGQTLAQGSMGDEGIKPTYVITKVILEKILN